MPFTMEFTSRIWPEARLGFACGTDGPLGSAPTLTVGVAQVQSSLFAGLRHLLLALDEAQKIWLAAMEVGVRKIPELCVGVAFEHALLEVRNFVKPIHVQLANERAEIPMLEPSSKDFVSEALVV